MKRLPVLLLVFVLAVTASFSQAKMVVEGGDTYDWGDVWQKDSPLKAKVKIHNKGTDSLIIFSVKPGCGCTAAPLDKKRIEPGGFTTMDIELAVGNFNGNIMKTIAISTSDPDAYRYTYNLKANVLVPLITKQNYIFFPEAVVGKESQFVLTVQNKHDKAIIFKNYVIVPDNVSINLGKDYVLQAGKEVNIVVKVTPDRAGRLQGAMVIQTDTEEMPRLRVNIMGDVKEAAAN